MRHGQKNRLFGPLHGERRAVRNGVGPVVQRDEGVRPPGVHVERDDARVGDHHRAHREVVGGQGRDDQALARRGHDGTSGAERIGCRSGGRRDDHPVSVVGGHHLPVDVGLHRDHPCAVALHGEFVERQLRFGLSGEFARDAQHRARLGRDVAFGYLAEDQVQPVARGAGQKPQVPGVDAHYGNRRAAETVHPFEQRSVASVADHDGFGRLFADVAAVDPFGRERRSRGLLHQGGELLVDGVIEAESSDRSDQLADLLGGVGDLRAGKKYDFHRRSFEKISNFTTPERSGAFSARQGAGMWHISGKYTERRAMRQIYLSLSGSRSAFRETA